MSTSTDTVTSRPYGLFALIALACPLYFLMIANALNTVAGGGEASMANAFEALFVITGLWILLAIIVTVGGVMGAMPRWAAVSAIFLIPVSAVAAFTAIDMCSRHMKWAVVFPALLALIIVAYAYWARSTQLHDAWPPKRTSQMAWGAVLVLSLLPFALASVY
ncbi:MAG TPA: hypothetical protein VHL13_08750 [Pseudolabrys sp.]|jgi:hypothetical protein|nr:hypothetical protein [Pseudolabrys sp.]